MCMQSSLAKNDADTEQALITVYIPTFNREQLLRRALYSVLGQTYQNIEVIVIDDCSTDGTREFLEKMTLIDRRVHYLIQSFNSGACAARNRAISLANGKFITGLDDDDYFQPQHLEQLVSAWKKKDHQSIAIYTNTMRKLPGGYKKALPKAMSTNSQSLKVSNWIGNQIFVQTQVLRGIGGFSTDFPAWQDYECWYRLLSSTGKVAECNGEYSYVLDLSHAHERVSNNGNSVEKAFRMFSSKHYMCDEEIEILSVNLVPYGLRSVSILLLFKKIVSLPNFTNFRHCLSIAFRAYFSRSKY